MDRMGISIIACIPTGCTRAASRRPIQLEKGPNGNQMAMESKTGYICTRSPFHSGRFGLTNLKFPFKMCSSFAS